MRNVEASSVDENPLHASGKSIYAVVATARYLLLVNLATKRVIPLEFNRPEYYGISWFSDSLHFVLSHSNIDNADLVSLSDYALSEQGTLSFGGKTSPKFLSQPHQIVCAPDARIVCTNTGRNAITVYGFDKPNVFQEARISELRWDRLSLEESSGDHLNSVFLKNDRLYAVAHGHTHGSKLVTLTYPQLEIVSIKAVPTGTGLHNIWVTAAGAAISCHSETGSLVDVERDEVLWSSAAPVYTRGLAASSDFILVGESQKSGRDLRRSTISGVWLIDRNSMKTLDYYCLGPYGAVHEVRLLNVADEAHHGHVFRGLPSLLSHDASHEMAQHRIQTWKKAQLDQQVWRDFQVVCGTPIPGENSARSAEPGQLCILTQPQSAGNSQWKMSFRYSLDHPKQDCHVSVVNYRGTGGDTDMHAIIIQPCSDTEGMLSFWKHDGRTWERQPGEGIRNLPLTASVRVQADKKGVDLKINNMDAIHIPATSLPTSTGLPGLRFMGATVYPTA